ncbi:MAG: lysostaphin resistance A-like protein [Planctomycetota bacterium]
MSNEEELRTPAELEQARVLEPVTDAVPADAVPAEVVRAEQSGAESPPFVVPPPVLPWPPPLPPSKPIIWLAFLVVIAGWMTASTVAGVLLVVGLISERGPEAFKPPRVNVEKLTAEYATTGTGLLVVALTPQLIFALSAIVPAFFSAEGFRQRLRLRRGRGSRLAWIPLALATPGIGFITSWLGSMVFTKRSSHLNMMAEMFNGAQGWIFFLLLFLIGIMPAIGEEFLFRGYLQSRLEKRWRPWLAILVSSILFAMAHFDPMHVVLVLPLGIWFGVVSWYTDSLIPPMLAHMANNVLAVIMTRRSFALTQGELRTTTLAEDLSDPWSLVVLVVTLISLLISVGLLLRRPPLPSPSPQPLS